MITRLSQALERMVTADTEALMSSAQADEWESLRESLGDPVLLGVDVAKYRRHMQLVAAQLLQGAVAQAMGGPASFLSDPMAAFTKLQRVHQLVDERVNATEPVVQDYNRAYGAPAGQWAAQMVRVFEKNACRETLRPPTVDVVARYWQSSLVAYREKFARGLTE